MIPLLYFKRPTVFLGIVLGLFAAIAGCSSSLPNSYEAELADHLSESGAKMYGAYWCPHCANQKDYFGGAAHRIPYVECDPDGKQNQAQRCAELNIVAYPTWNIEGESYLGAQYLGKLARLSGFEGAVPTQKDLSSSSGEVSPAY